MKISRDPTEIIAQMRENSYFLAKDPDPSVTWNVLKPDGSRPRDFAGRSYVERPLSWVTPVIGVWFDSTFFGPSDGKDERNENADCVLIFKGPDGLYANKYSCAGYSSVTFEPENDFDFIPGGTFADLCAFAVDDKQREWVEAAIGQLMLEDNV